MEYQRVTIPCKHTRTELFTIVPIGDIHEGNIGCCEKTLLEQIDWIKNNKNVFWIGMGDFAEAINYSDPRFDIKSVSRKYRGELGDIDMMVQLQVDTICKLFEPIKDKCLGLHRGNHEECIRRYFHYDILYELWKKLKVKLLYDVAITRLQFTAKNSRWTNSFDIFSTHGCIAGRKSGGKVNRLEDLMAGFEADIYLSGHAHVKTVTTTNRLYIDQAGNLKSKRKIGAYTGSFLRGYNINQTSYIEKGNFPASDIGVVKIIINPRKNDMNIHI